MGKLTLATRLRRRFVWRYQRIKLEVLQRIGKKEVMSSYGVLMTKNWLDATFRFCVSGSYGRYYSEHLNQVGYRFLFLDIGSNQGLYSMLAARNPNCISATCFEPVKSTFKLLVANIKINNLESKCLPVNKGIGKLSGTSSINIRKNHSGAASQLNPPKGEALITEKVEIVDGEYLDRMAIAVNGYPIICKIDVEGKELDVIEALMASRAWERIREIYYEMDEAWVDSKRIKGLLQAGGFNSFQKIGSHPTHYDVMATR